MITLSFVTGNDAISSGIRAAEYDFWASHVEALMPDDTLLGAHVNGSVQARTCDYDEDSFTREACVLIAASPGVTDAFHSFLRGQIGKPYDIGAILSFVLRRDWQQPDAWCCSELQAAALAACGWFSSALATEFNHITPRDLLLIISGRVAITGAAQHAEDRS